MRRPERPRHQQTRFGAELPGYRMYLRGFERLLQRHRRHNRRHTPRQHRFARPRRPDHQYVVPAGRRDLQRPFHMRQPPDVAEIDVEPFGIFPESSFEIDRCPRKGMLPAQESDHLAQMTGSVNLQRSDDRRLRRILFRQDNPFKSLFLRLYGDRQRAPYRQQRTVQRQLALQHITSHLFGSRQNSHRDRQIVSRPFFADIGRGKVDDHLPTAHLVRTVFESGPDTFLAFAHRIVRQSDHVESDPRRDIHLDGDRDRLDADNGASVTLNEHNSLLRCYAPRTDPKRLFKNQILFSFRTADSHRPAACRNRRACSAPIPTARRIRHTRRNRSLLRRRHFRRR